MLDERRKIHPIDKLRVCAADASGKGQKEDPNQPGAKTIAISPAGN
jgi:hypothetical protein